MLANGSFAVSAMPLVLGAKLLARGAPVPTGAMEPKRLLTREEMPPVKFISARSARPKAVGSIVATRLPLTRKGAPPVVIVAPVGALGPLNVKTYEPPRKFTVSWLPRATRPMTREPGRKVSVSWFELLKSMAVPAVPMIVPELTRVDPTPLTFANIPVPAEMVPELLTLAVTAMMPTPPRPPEIVPELLTLAVPAMTLMASPLNPNPEIVPELVMLATEPRTAMPLPPEMVPELAMLTGPSVMMPLLPAPEIVPELVTASRPAELFSKIPLAVPVMVPKLVMLNEV